MFRTLCTFVGGSLLGALLCLASFDARPVFVDVWLPGSFDSVFEPEQMLDADGAPRPAPEDESRKPGLAGRPDETDDRTMEEILEEFRKDGPWVTPMPTPRPSLGGLELISLAPDERAAVERVLAAAQARLDDLYATPGDDGRSWQDHSDDPEGSVAVHQHTFVPGSTETFAEAAARIRDGAIKDAQDVVSASKRDLVPILAAASLSEPGEFSGFLGGGHRVRGRILAIRRHVRQAG